MRIEDLWSSRSPGAAIGRILLTPASWLYVLGWECYATTYRIGIKRAQEPFRPTVCVGNLVVGGSGKTPTTLSIARLLIEMDQLVVLSLSGYGSPRSEAASVAPEGPLDASEWGDEPAMVRWLLPHVPMVVGRRRVLAAELAALHFPDHVLLMDDGFQHLPLKKHVTIVLDEADPFNRLCLPAGPYREPRRNRRMADTLLNGQFRLERSPLRFLSADGKAAQPPAQAVMLCAIANPDAFSNALRESCVQVLAQRRHADHDPLTAGKLFDGLENDAAVVVTAKDWVKLRARKDLSGRNILIAIQDSEVEPRAEFSKWIDSRLVRARTTQ